MEIREFFHATKVISGAGSVEKAGEEVLVLDEKKALIITDGFLASSPIYEKVIKRSVQIQEQRIVILPVKWRKRKKWT